MKKYFYLFATLICLLFFVGLDVKAEKYGDYEYKVNSNGSVEITGYTGKSKQLTIPSSLAGNKVTSIADNAFEWSYTLESLVIPDVVTHIGNSAFINCEALKIVTIPKSVKTIEYFAFGYQEIMDSSADCEKIVHMSDFTIKGYKGTIAEKYAKENSFKFVALDSAAEAKKKSVKVGSTQTVGGNRYVVTSSTTVRYRKPVSKKITKIKVPKSIKIDGKKFKVTAIADKAFVGCSKLKTVIITGTIKKIGKCAFYNCKKLRTIRIFTSKLAKSNVLKGAFQGIYKKAVFYVPKGKKAAYKKIFLKRGATKKMKFKTN